ncbi:MAG: hypothetical protein HY547_06860 [Elusimicrobia bacterium]|nr:hypothetical protein [Elusimicrobiota bacterium]
MKPISMLNYWTWASLIASTMSCYAIGGPAITNNNYRVDLTQSVALGSTRKVAMGGAYVAIAEGAAGLPDNFASAAFRPRYSTGPWRLSLSLGSVAASGNDFDNNGSELINYKNHSFYSGGILLQRHNFGFGFFGILQQYDLEGFGSRNRFNFSISCLAAGYSFWDRQITLGAGLRPGSLRIVTTGEEHDELLSLNSGGINIGALIHPDKGPLRIGVSFAAALRSRQSLVANSTVPVEVAGLIIPEEVSLPMESSVGISYEWKEAPFWKGHAFLAGAEVRFIGETENAYGIESFLEQKAQLSGAAPTMSPKLGAEIDAIPGRLRVRLGTYLEPSRFEGVSSRLHLTSGFEIKTFRFYAWGEQRLSLLYAIDWAQDYLNNFVSLSLWR